MPPALRQLLYAPACVTAGMAIVAFSDNFVGIVAEGMSLGQFQVIRCIAAVGLGAAVAAMLGGLGRLRPVNPGGLAMRTLFNVTALMLYFGALPTVPIAQAAAGMFTSPIWVAVFSGLFFGVPIGPRRLGALALGFAGVALVLQVGEKPVQPMALVAVVAGMSYAMSVIWTRRHCTRETGLRIAFWNFVGYGAAGLAVMIAGPVVAAAAGPLPQDLAFMLGGVSLPGWPALLIAVAIGLSSLLSSGLMAEGYKSAESSLAAMFDFSFLIWAPLFAWLLWGDTITGLQALGMVLIVAAGTLALWSGARVESRGN